MLNIRSETRQVSSLVPYARNSKLHTPEQVAQIGASIRRFGFNDPVGIRENGTIVEGHGRVMAAKEAGLDSVPVIVLPASMTDEEVDLYRIAHNRLALISTFDFPMLVEELREIVSDTAAFTDMGFSQAAADNLFQMFTGNAAPEPTAHSGGAGSGGVGGQHNPEAQAAGLVFDIIWDDKEQQTRWREFLTSVLALRPNATRGTALVEFMNDVMNGVIAPCGDTPEAEEPVTAENAGDHQWH